MCGRACASMNDKRQGGRQKLDAESFMGGWGRGETGGKEEGREEGRREEGGEEASHA